jgi:hypothetical protein
MVGKSFPGFLGLSKWPITYNLHVLHILWSSSHPKLNYPFVMPKLQEIEKCFNKMKKERYDADLLQLFIYTCTFLTLILQG